MKSCAHLCWWLAQFFLEGEIFQTNVVEKIKTQFYVPYLFPENRAIYEMTWKNMVQSDRSHVTIQYIAEKDAIWQTHS